MAQIGEIDILINNNGDRRIRVNKRVEKERGFFI